jgi:hypothetical protein
MNHMVFPTVNCTRQMKEALVAPADDAVAEPLPTSVIDVIRSYRSLFEGKVARELICKPDRQQELLTFISDLTFNLKKTLIAIV